MDIVFIEGLQVDAVIGVYDWEKTQQQPLVFDVQMFTDIQGAAADDDLRQTLNYAVVAERIREYVSATQFELVETLAEKLAQLLLAEFAMAEVQIRLSKPQAVPGANVGVQIRRARC